MGMRITTMGLNEKGWMKANIMVDGVELTLSFNANGIDKAKLDDVIEDVRNLATKSLKLHQEAARYCMDRDNLTLGGTQ